METRDLIAEVAALPVEERAMVADSILRTLNTPDPEMDRKWAEVARQRLSEIRSQQAELVPGHEVFARIWNRFGK